jgi:ABC-type multidrug transport system fused ATPase/permease subunit
LRQLFDTAPTLTRPAAPHPIAQARGDIVFDGVTLSYGDHPVLRGSTFTARAGCTTALVGASGAGKSTIFNVLTRLAEADGGQVSIGGVDILALDPDALRAQFSMVTQDATLFDETVRDNILLGRADVDEAALARALDAAQVSGFLPRLPHGLDSAAGPRGSALSGGQRQRVAIARALLRDTPILLLDEATSALDAESEAAVQRALDALSTGRTTLVIAHRLATVRKADHIVVMDAGRVVEQGTHDDLLARRGAYARLHALQFDTGGAA